MSVCVGACVLMGGIFLCAINVYYTYVYYAK